MNSGPSTASQLDLNLCRCGLTSTNEDSLWPISLRSIHLALHNLDLASTADATPAPKIWFESSFLSQLKDGKVVFGEPTCSLLGFGEGNDGFFDVGLGHRCSSRMEERRGAERESEAFTIFRSLQEAFITCFQSQRRGRAVE